MKNYINVANENFIHTYNRFPVAFDYGKGVNLYDTEGKEYLDFAAGIAVFALGYGNEEYNNALKAQIDKIIHTSNLYYNIPAIEAAGAIKNVSGMDKVFFTNSGTEAVEGAIKLARKYYYTKTGKTDGRIIAMKQSFHGRSMGALTVTGQPKYQEAFMPLIGNVDFAVYNDLESVKALICDETCAIIFETLQGEGGIHTCNADFIKEIRKICDEKDILLILDEIQCGMGRTGKMFAYEHYDVKPDIVTMAKALGCGVPVGAFAANDKAAAAFVPGDHGTTYGGNPFATAAVLKVIELFQKENVLENVKEVGDYLYQQLEEIKESSDIVVDHRGMGLMQGLELSVPASDIVNKALENGLVLISAGANIVRFVPPLVITKEDVDKMISILKKCI